MPAYSYPTFKKTIGVISIILFMKVMNETTRYIEITPIKNDLFFLIISDVI